MRFSQFIVISIITYLISFILETGLHYSAQFNEILMEKQRDYTEKKFIAESFRNTCKGTGFENLEQWQISCRNLFDLDYIAWCDSEEFMIDEHKEGNQKLVYGKWVSKDKRSDGEVYCRLNSMEND